jgi:exodeoxyribonuclease V beta subunit
VKEPGLLANLNLTGNRLGQRVHHLLEDILGNGRPLESVTEHLSHEWQTVLETILHAPIALGSDITTLWQVRPRAIAEMHVLLPVASITPHNLSEALLSDPLIARDPERHTWAADIATWGFGVLAGFFQGYIDLTFEHHGRYYIIDYKTNALQGYGARELETAMLQHHYLLQARLYTLALHRHLKATMNGYQPEVHLGGCAYLFVRGFPKQGTWFECATAASLARLDALFAEAVS